MVRRAQIFTWENIILSDRKVSPPGRYPGRDPDPGSNRRPRLEKAGSTSKRSRQASRHGGPLAIGGGGGLDGLVRPRRRHRNPIITKLETCAVVRVMLCGPRGVKRRRCTSLTFSHRFRPLRLRMIPRAPQPGFRDIHIELKRNERDKGGGGWGGVQSLTKWAKYVLAMSLKGRCRQITNGLQRQAQAPAPAPISSVLC